MSDEYFIKRKLYPNVDFYSGIIYQALGFTPDIFTVLFAIGRTVGWLAQWQELLTDKEQKIARPRQIYTGYDQRDVVPMASREVVRTGPSRFERLGTASLSPVRGSEVVPYSKPFSKAFRFSSRNAGARNPRPPRRPARQDPARRRRSPP